MLAVAAEAHRPAPDGAPGGTQHCFRGYSKKTHLTKVLLERGPRATIATFAVQQSKKSCSYRQDPAKVWASASYPSSVG